MQNYAFFFLSGMFVLGLVANFSFGAASASALGDAIVLEQEGSNVLESSSDSKPHRGSGR